MSQQPRYKFYPSLLDSFQSYLDSSRIWNEYWGASEEPSKTETEFEQEQFDGLFDKINRVPSENEAAEKGTAFNDLVDHYIKQHLTAAAWDELVAKNPELTVSHTSRMGTAYTFSFSSEIVREFVYYFRGAVSQVFCRGYVETKYGMVELYGYIDELIADTVYDIKTTKKYSFGKFHYSWQKHTYPVCLEQMGCKVRGFEYTVTDFRNTYREWYDYHPDKSYLALQGICERFIEFIEQNRERIKDRKIFNQE